MIKYDYIDVLPSLCWSNFLFVNDHPFFSHLRIQLRGLVLPNGLTNDDLMQMMAQSCRFFSEMTDCFDILWLVWLIFDVKFFNNC